MYPPADITHINVETAVEQNRGFGFDGGSSAPSTAIHTQTQVPVAATAIAYTIAAFNSSGVAVSGSAGITISKGALGALSSQGSKTLTTATSATGSLNFSLAAGDWLDVSLDSVSGAGVTKIEVMITVKNTVA